MEAIVSTNDINNYSVSELNYLRESIENMNKFNQVEVLRILNKHKDGVTLNENKYGIHINLSDLFSDYASTLKTGSAQNREINKIIDIGIKNIKIGHLTGNDVNNLIFFPQPKFSLGGMKHLMHKYEKYVAKIKSLQQT